MVCKDCLVGNDYPTATCTADPDIGVFALYEQS